MTGQNLFQTAQKLVQKIDRANTAKRVALQPELSHILTRLKAEGQTVPREMRQLDIALREEAIESLFDNMPV